MNDNFLFFQAYFHVEHFLEEGLIRKSTSTDFQESRFE